MGPFNINTWQSAKRYLTSCANDTKHWKTISCCYTHRKRIRNQKFWDSPIWCFRWNRRTLHLNMLKCRKGQQARWYGDEIGVCHLYSFIFYCSKFKAWRQKSKHLTRHFLYVVEPPKLSVLSAFDTTRKRIAVHFVSYFWRFHHIDCLSSQRYCQGFLLLKYSLAETNRGDWVKQLFQQLFKKNFQVCKMHGKMLRWPFATLPVLRHFFSSVGFSFTTTFTRRHHAISAIYLLWNIKPYKKNRPSNVECLPREVFAEKFTMFLLL